MTATKQCLQIHVYFCFTVGTVLFVQAGIVRLWWDAVAPFIYVCTLDGTVHLWDSRNGERVAQWFGHTDGILDFKVSRFVLNVLVSQTRSSM